MGLPSKTIGWFCWTTTSETSSVTIRRKTLRDCASVSGVFWAIAMSSSIIPLKRALQITWAIILRLRDPAPMLSRPPMSVFQRLLTQ